MKKDKLDTIEFPKLPVSLETAGTPVLKGKKRAAWLRKYEKGKKTSLNADFVDPEGFLELCCKYDMSPPQLLTYFLEHALKRFEKDPKFRASVIAKAKELDAQESKVKTSLA